MGKKLRILESGEVENPESAELENTELLKKLSGRWGCRPLVGMGVMEVHEFEVGVTPNQEEDASGVRQSR